MSKIGTLLGVAAAYASIVFGIGFVLGAIRVFLVVPRIGARAAELLELPLMVAVSYLAAGWVRRRLGPKAAAAQRLGIGMAALLLTLVAEALIGLALRDGTVREVLVNPDPVSGPLYYLSLVLFALLPALRGTPHPPSEAR